MSTTGSGISTSGSSLSQRIRTDVYKLMMSDYEVSVADGSNLRELFILFKGPGETPYSGGTWKVHVELPEQYPFKSPSIGFVNRIFHPNIEERSGSVCLDVINQAWQPMFDLLNVFESFLPQLLRYPNATDPLNGEAASLLMRDPRGYEARVREYVERYATGVMLSLEDREVRTRRSNSSSNNNNNNNSSSSGSSRSQQIQQRASTDRSMPGNTTPVRTEVVMRHASTISPESTRTTTTSSTTSATAAAAATATAAATAFSATESATVVPTESSGDDDDDEEEEEDDDDDEVSDGERKQQQRYNQSSTSASRAKGMPSSAASFGSRNDGDSDDGMSSSSEISLGSSVEPDLEDDDDDNDENNNNKKV